MFVLAPSLPQHLMKTDRLELQVHRVISNLYRNLNLLQLLLESVDRPPAVLQPPLLGARSDSDIEMIMGTFDGLDRPKQIFAGDLEQHRLMPRVTMDTRITAHAPARLADDDTVCGGLIAPLYRPNAASHPVHVGPLAEGRIRQPMQWQDCARSFPNGQLNVSNNLKNWSTAYRDRMTKLPLGSGFLLR